MLLPSSTQKCYTNSAGWIRKPHQLKTSPRPKKTTNCNLRVSSTFSAWEETMILRQNDTNLCLGRLCRVGKTLSIHKYIALFCGTHSKIVQVNVFLPLNVFSGEILLLIESNAVFQQKMALINIFCSFFLCTVIFHENRNWPSILNKYQH